MRKGITTQRQRDNLVTSGESSQPLQLGLASPLATLFWDPLLTFFTTTGQSAEAAGVTAGTAVHNTKDLFDKWVRLLNSAPDRDDANVPNRQKSLKAIADALQEALDKGREAKNTTAGAAAGAKKHKDARPALGKARKAFNEAEDQLEEARRKIEDSNSGDGDNRQDDLDQAKAALDEAKKKFEEALEGLQDALDAIQG